LAEGGLFPGVTYYLSMWYKRAEQSRRVAVFFSAATIAGAFGGLLAYAIENLEGRAGLHGWAWIVSHSTIFWNAELTPRCTGDSSSLKV